MHTDTPPPLRLNDQEYFEKPGLTVALGQDFYPDGHQGGVVIIQHGARVASNGDLRLEVCGGQWQPIPRQTGRRVDPTEQAITVDLAYPDPARNGIGFNPIHYPDLAFDYRLTVTAEGPAFRIRVDLGQPLPGEWESQVKFCLEWFPGTLFGAAFLSDTGAAGIFPRQPNGPGIRDAGQFHLKPLATGRTLTIAPERDLQRVVIHSLAGGELQLLDGRERHTNGWFILQAGLQPGTLRGAVEWLVEPHTVEGFVSKPTLQINQVGYRPDQEKRVIVELDRNTVTVLPLEVRRIRADGSREVAARGGREWGAFLRYRYHILDFSAVREEGLYEAAYGNETAGPFRIAADVYSRHVWQPTLEFFLPVQMCHMRVEDGYRVWHGDCHGSDAVMAGPKQQHFDGYLQGPELLVPFEAGEAVPGLNEGGWHDAGDFDLRVESQAGTVHGLALAQEEFGVDLDTTTVDWEKRRVVLRQPDGTPDILQQIEHGLRSLLGSWRTFDRLYRGIVEADLEDYVLIGDPVNHRLPRLVFTEDNPVRELEVGAALAAADRVLRTHRPALARECREAAEELWRRSAAAEPKHKLGLAVELLLGQESDEPSPWAAFLADQAPVLAEDFARSGWKASRALGAMETRGHLGYRAALEPAARKLGQLLADQEKETPYGIPYRPHIWGAGWAIQHHGVQQYYLHQAWPGYFGVEGFYRALDFVLGCHPGANNASFVSGVGARSVTTAYGLNRADHSFIPGGSVSGTSLIRPDLPELLEWPYLWQQTEYVLGGGTSDWLFLALAADRWH